MFWQTHFIQSEFAYEILEKVMPYITREKEKILSIKFSNQYFEEIVIIYDDFWKVVFCSIT